MASGEAILCAAALLSLAGCRPEGVEYEAPDGTFSVDFPSEPHVLTNEQTGQFGFHQSYCATTFRFERAREETWARDLSKTFMSSLRRRLSNRGGAYCVSVRSFPSVPENPGEVLREYRGELLREGMSDEELSESQRGCAWEVVEERSVVLGEFPGYEVKNVERCGSRAAWHGVDRFYVVGSRLYALEIGWFEPEVPEADTPMGVRFFDSFRVRVDAKP